MIQTESFLRVSDNSGARNVKCIRVLGGFNKRIGVEGDYIMASVQNLRLIKKIKKGDVVLALIIQTVKKSSFKDGSSNWFNNNNVLLLNKKKRLLSTRIFGLISRKLRKRKFLRILLLNGYFII